MANPRNESSSRELTFRTFYDEWLLGQRSLLDQLHLLHSSILSFGDEVHQNDERQRNLIEQVLSHYQRYFDDRNDIAGDDVFFIISSPWLNSFERTYLWIAGFRPTLILRLAESGVDDLSAEQARGLSRLKSEMARAEREVTETMAAVQESVAVPPIVALVRRIGRLIDGEVSSLHEAMETLKAAMIRVLRRADELRGSALRNVVEVLTPPQTIKFLVAAAEFQLRLRRWGAQSNSQ